jgi:hypothetical protein
MDPDRVFSSEEDWPGRSTLPPALRSRPEVRFPDPVTIGLVGGALGDAVKTVCYALWVRETLGLKVSLYANCHGFRGIDFRPEPLARKGRLVREILDVLAVPGPPLPVVTDTPIEEVYVPGQYPWHFPQAIGTRERWRGWPRGLHRRITYQLDAVSNHDRKNPPGEDVPRLLGFAPGFEMVRLGGHLSLRECVAAAASSDLFFGVDSGMMQLCYAVGVPAFLLNYCMDPLVLFGWHGDRHAVVCSDTDDFLFKARAFLGLP